jgi:hypothetical protein
VYPLQQLQAPQGGSPAAQGAYKPHPRLPSHQSLSYVKVGLELLLLLLAVPWILRELTRHPGQVSRKAASKHLSG